MAKKNLKYYIPGAIALFEHRSDLAGARPEGGGEAGGGPEGGGALRH